MLVCLHCWHLGCESLAVRANLPGHVMSFIHLFLPCIHSYKMTECDSGLGVLGASGPHKGSGTRCCKTFDFVILLAAKPPASKKHLPSPAVPGGFSEQLLVTGEQSAPCSPTTIPKETFINPFEWIRFFNTYLTTLRKHLTDQFSLIFF